MISDERLRAIIKPGDTSMGGEEIGHDCCGDRYEVNCSVNCDCGCNRAYCHFHFQHHQLFILASELLAARARIAELQAAQQSTQQIAEQNLDDWKADRERMEGEIRQLGKALGPVTDEEWLELCAGTPVNSKVIECYMSRREIDLWISERAALGKT